jgi:drug/metabolite transporter (DMT)-like permease
VNGRPAGTAALVGAAMIAFAANSLLCRSALLPGAIDAVSFTTLRLGAGALALGLLARGRGLRQHGSQAAAWFLFAYALCFSLAYRSIPAGTGALLLFGAVQVTMVAFGLLGGERPPTRVWAGLVLALAGLVVLTAPGLAQPDPLGAASMALAGVAWGLYSLRGRGSAAALQANAANFARTVPLALLASLVAWPCAGVHVTARGALLAVASGALASGLGYAIWYAVLPRLAATTAAIVQLTVPPMAAFGGVLWLGEVATARLWTAAAAILGGVALAVTARRR